MEEFSSDQDQLEEGEIVDDDDFEDISDNSIIDSTFGKFVSPNENLRALSLSSDSDVEILSKDIKQRKSQLPHNRNRTKHLKKRKRHKALYDSSDSDISTCADLKDKLKEAVHINEIDEGQKKPLETRLKGMWGLTSNNVETNSPEPLPLIENEISTSSDKIDDHELEKLRIEALKTAVLNKFQRRKRRKAILEEHKEEPIKTMENKENDTPKADNNLVNPKGDTITPALDVEEDEDVLRASLLAGLAKKITKVQANEDVVQVKPDAPILPNKGAPMLPKLPVFKKKVIQNRPKPQVKPLIININEDSDSEEEETEKTEPLTKVSDLNVISSNVEKFLKEQRAKFETETKKRFQIVNKNKSILEKSAVKLLPKSQQIEYQQLLKKLKMAEKRKKAKKVALQKTESQPKNSCESKADPIKPSELSSKPVAVDRNPPLPKSDTPENQTVRKSENSELKKSNEIQENARKKDSSQDGKKSGITCELTILQKTLKEIKMQRNGSLQIKSKYQLLTPIIRKITEASNERKKQEQRIKYLLQDLNEAKKNLAQSHEKFSSLVRELIDEKGKIDSSCCEDTNLSAIQKPNSSIRRNSSQDSVENNDVKSKPPIDNNGKTNKFFPLTSTPIVQKGNKMLTIDEVAVPAITPPINDDYEDMDVCNSDETDICQIDIVDPNDIDQIFTRKSLVKMTIPEYVSPLNLNERYRHVDPHGIMCPYEVNGSCRDIDCTFKHYLKNSGKLKQ